MAAAAGPIQASEIQTYTYDARGRLIKVVRAGTVNNGITACYSYDSAENRSNVTASTTSNCSPPSFSIDDASIVEGGTLLFTVTKLGGGSGSVQYATADGTAKAKRDYTATSGTLSFLSTDTSKTISVQTTPDTTGDGDETVLLNLSNASPGATVTDPQAVGTIVDDDNAANCTGVSFTITSLGPVVEGTNSVFKITKSGTTASSCRLNYATANLTAIAGSDYNAKSGTLSFSPTATFQKVAVATIDDAAIESSETFQVTLSLPGDGASLGNPSSATATINDSDSPVDQPPTAVDDTGSQQICSTEDYNVTGNDSDPDGDPIEVIAVTGAGFSVLDANTVQFNSPQLILPETGTYTIQDTRGATATATLSVTVTGGICQ